MKVLIIEDEKPAADKLARLLKRYDADVQILDVLGSVEQSVAWFKESSKVPDLIFMDIQLSDGLCFEIFRRIGITYPVIFTTAYNEYALEAFKVCSIDYLLKPVTYEDLYASMEKLAILREKLTSPGQRLKIEELNQLLDQVRINYKNRFMVKIGEHIRSVKVENILLFYADGRVVYILTDQGREYIIDYKMEELEDLLDPEIFFRINRTFMVSINAIKDVIIYSNSRLKVVINQPFDRDLIVSREKVGQFKMWFGMR